MNDKPKLIAWRCVNKNDVLYGMVALRSGDSPSYRGWERVPHLDGLDIIKANFQEQNPHAYEAKEDPEMELLNKFNIALQALALIATPPRPDGTYNRCREACEVLARDTLKRIAE